jgi:hypothetical protein
MWETIVTPSYMTLGGNMAFLPILFPIYLWDCWSNEHEDCEARTRIVVLMAEDVTA